MLIRYALLLHVPESEHLWFLKAIFVLNLLNPIVYRFINDNRRHLYYLIILLGLWSIDFIDIAISRFTNPMVHWMAAYSVLYYLLGYAALNHQIPKLEKFLQGRRGFWLLVGGISGCALLQWGYNWIFLDGPMKEMNSAKEWISNIVWDNYNAIFVVLMTIAVCMLFQRIKWKENRFWMFVGRYSLAIYVLQTPVQRLLEWGLPLKHLTEQLHVYGIILPVLTLLVCMVITWLMLTNKYTKFLIEL